MDIGISGGTLRQLPLLRSDRNATHLDTMIASHRRSIGYTVHVLLRPQLPCDVVGCIYENWQHAEACPGACSREFGWDVDPLVVCCCGNKSDMWDEPLESMIASRGDPAILSIRFLPNVGGAS